jgi:signal transduction histidine kinase
VQDSGEGVPEENLGNIFEPFYRGGSTPTEGAGIGLAISRQAINLMKGSIQAVSAPGAGLRVSLSLPLASNRAFSH